MPFLEGLLVFSGLFVNVKDEALSKAHLSTVEMIGEVLEGKMAPDRNSTLL